jgi:hypothetical protein
VNTPRRPEGRGNETTFAQWVWDRLAKELRFADSPTIKWSRTTNGLSANAKGQSGGSGILQTYRVKSRLEDVLVCRTYDGTTEGDEDVFVAVNRNCRYVNTLDGEILFDGTHYYTAGTALDAFNLVRIDTLGADAEEQVVSPLYYEDCEIDVMQTNYSGVYYDDTVSEDLQPVTLIEVSARCWAKIEDPPA